MLSISVALVPLPLQPPVRSNHQIGAVVVQPDPAGQAGGVRPAGSAMLRFANAAAYLVTARKGAIRSMPEAAEVVELLAGNP